MAMLAEPRRKQKWTLNPRGKHWSEDSNKFGQKMLEKMGWSSGKGLGANLDGMTEHVRLQYKDDQAGIGFSHADRDKQWTQHQEGFNELLQKLHNGEAASTPSVETELSGKSLELKSKQSRARVHYQKFTRGKDVNKYSAKDLANIFGKKTFDEKSQEPEKVITTEPEPPEIPAEPIGSCDTSHGVVTIKGGSISDYFKTKMSVLGRKSNTEIPQDSESETENYPGFGFSSAPKKSDSTKKSLETHEFSFVNPALNLASPNESKNTPRKRKNDYAFENPALDVASPNENPETPRKRKNNFVFDNPGLQLGEITPEAKQTPKKRKSEFAFENGGLDLEYAENGGSAEAAILRNDDSAKKKRKKQAKECIPTPIDGIINEALNLEIRDDEITNSNQFEVPRTRLGLSNDALDLTDETNGRKRVTFNEAVEYETDVVAVNRKKKKKNKMAVKLDKFEVDNEKIKRKKKKARKDEVVESAFVNVAMDVDAMSQEANDNAANERKSERARRKRDRRRSNLETIAEVPDEERESVVEIVTLDESLVGETSEDLKVLSLETTKKKDKKKKISGDQTIVGKNVENVDLETTIDISEEDVELVEEISSVDVDKVKKSKKKTKKLRENEDEAKRIKKKKKDSTTIDEDEVMEIVEMESADSERTKKERTKKKLISEDSKENVDTENVATISENPDNVESAKKRKKQKKEKKDREIENGTEKNQTDEKKSVEENFQNGGQSPREVKIHKSKKSFKTLFARSPIVNFVGSNINDIKGYGMDLK